MNGLRPAVPLVTCSFSGFAPQIRRQKFLGYRHPPDRGMAVKA